MFKFCFDVVLMYFLTYIKATTAGTCITFLTDVTSGFFLLFVFVQTRVVTIENLTSFHEYIPDGDFVVYLGGFHNKVKREFLCFLFEQNPEKEYRHFGDIDAGGFYILEHLKRKTGIPFLSLYMDTKILQIYRESTMPLTTGDRKRLHALYDELQEKIAEIGRAHV